MPVLGPSAPVLPGSDMTGFAEQWSPQSCCHCVQCFQSTIILPAVRLISQGKTFPLDFEHTLDSSSRAKMSAVLDSSINRENDDCTGQLIPDFGLTESVGHGFNGLIWCSFRAPGISDNPNQFWDSPPREDIPDYLSRPEPQEGFVITPEIFSVDSQHRLMIDDLSKNKKLHSAAVPAAT